MVKLPGLSVGQLIIASETYCACFLHSEAVCEGLAAD